MKKLCIKSLLTLLALFSTLPIQAESYAYKIGGKGLNDLEFKFIDGFTKIGKDLYISKCRMYYDRAQELAPNIGFTLNGDLQNKKVLKLTGNATKEDDGSYRTRPKIKVLLEDAHENIEVLTFSQSACTVPVPGLDLVTIQMFINPGTCSDSRYNISNMNHDNLTKHILWMFSTYRIEAINIGGEIFHFTNTDITDKIKNTYRKIYKYFYNQ